MFDSARRVSRSSEILFGTPISGGSASDSPPPAPPSAARRASLPVDTPPRVRLPPSAYVAPVPDPNFSQSAPDTLNASDPPLIQNLRAWLDEEQNVPPAVREARYRAYVKITEAAENSAKKLVLNNLNLDTLPSCLHYLTSVTHLDLSGNQLRVLRDFPPNLEILEAASNELVWMSELPRSLISLGLDNNKFKFLEDSFGNPRILSNTLVLPPNLLTFSIRGNQLQYLPRLNDGLVTLVADHNELLQLPRLPQSLTYLSVSNNQISILRRIPTSLRDIDISNNKLGQLPYGFAETLKHGLVELTNNPWGRRTRDMIKEMATDTIVVDHNERWSDTGDFRMEGGNPVPFDPKDLGYRPSNMFRSLFRKKNVLMTAEQIVSKWEECHDPDQRAIRTGAAAKIRHAISRRARTLHLSELGLTSLPHCLNKITSLRLLNVEGNFLKELPALPPNLVTLIASRNKLRRLPTLPNSLQSLRARGNLLDSLGRLPPSLQELVIDHNFLRKLPTLPKETRHVSVSNNFLKYFPALGFRGTSFTVNIRSNKVRRFADRRFPDGICGFVEVTYNELRGSACEVFFTAPQTILVACGLFVRPNVETRRRPEYRPYSPPPGRWLDQDYRGPTRQEIAADRQDPSTWLQLPMSLRSNITRLEASPAVATPSGSITSPPAPYGFTGSSATASRVYTPHSMLVPAIEASETRPLQPATGESPPPIPSYIQRLRFAEGVETTAPRSVEEVTMRDAVKPWLNNPRALRRIAIWVDAANEVNAQVFAQFLNRLTGTREYQVEAYRPALKTRVNDLVIEMIDSAHFRELCFSIVLDATQSCGDRVTLALNDMELAHINYKAQQDHYTKDQLFDMGEGMFKLTLLDEIAAEHVISLREVGRSLDEIEVRLGFQTLLAQELNLPGVAQAMLYARCSNINAQDLSDAKQRVRHQVNNVNSIEFLSRWVPWQLALQREHPSHYADVNAEINQRRDRLSLVPVLANSQTYINQLKNLSDFETEQIAVLSVELTSSYLQQRQQQEQTSDLIGTPDSETTP